MDSSNKKLLSDYAKISDRVDDMTSKLEKRVKQACLIADSNREIFVPATLLQSVLTTQNTGSFMMNNSQRMMGQT